MDADPVELRVLGSLIEKQRTERMYGFGTLEDAERTLEGLAQRELVARQPRRPGQKEDRYAQLLGGEGEELVAGPAVSVSREDDRVAALEVRVTRLEEGLDELQRRV